MPIIAMQKVAILAHSSLQEELLSTLQDEGVLEVQTADSSDVDHTDVNFRIGDVEYAITTLKDFADKQTQEVARKKVRVEDVMHAAKHTDVRGIVETLKQLETDDTDAAKKLQELERTEAELAPWRNLNLSLSNEHSTETVRLFFGTLPVENERKLRDTLTQNMRKSILERVSDDESGSATFVAYLWHEDTATFEGAATTLGWTNVELPRLEETPAKICEGITMQMKALNELQEKNQAHRAKLSVELPNLLKVQTFMSWLTEKQAVRETIAETEQTVTLLGWMERDNVEKLESRLQKISPAVAVMKVKADEGEEPPVKLKNRKLIAPFESVTSLYGLPLANEMDPTAALSPFFILYFSLCLTDAGYGAVIALIFGIFLLKTKKSIEEAKLPWLLFFGGVCTFLVSIPFGGWFGLTPEQVPTWLSKETAEGLMFKGQIWNLSRESGITFLQNLSLVLGLTHLFFGMYLAGAYKWIHGRKSEAFWTDFTSHILLGAAIFVFVAPESMKNIAMPVLYGSLALAVWGKGYGQKWFLRPIMGALGLVNFAIGLLSNGLSYLRILALGLVTGAIAAAVNQVAIEMGGLFPLWIGIPVIILIFTAGHTVSIALNTLGSFIHSGRLQFIEFFSQFFEGGGKEFTPFRRSTL